MEFGLLGTSLFGRLCRLSAIHCRRLLWAAAAQRWRYPSNSNEVFVNSPPDRVPPFTNHPLWRYGFLVVIVGLLVMAYRTARTFPEMLGPASLNFMVASMLLVNHVVAAFLTPTQQRRVRVLQFGLIAACCLSVVVYIVGDVNQWF